MRPYAFGFSRCCGVRGVAHRSRESPVMLATTKRHDQTQHNMPREGPCQNKCQVSKSTQLDMRILRDGNGRKKNGTIAGIVLAALSSLAFLSRNWGAKASARYLSDPTMVHDTPRREKLCPRPSSLRANGCNYRSIRCQLAPGKRCNQLMTGCSLTIMTVLMCW